jgi:hypothetical protein
MNPTSSPSSGPASRPSRHKTGQRDPDISWRTLSFWAGMILIPLVVIFLIIQSKVNVQTEDEKTKLARREALLATDQMESDQADFLRRAIIRAKFEQDAELPRAIEAGGGSEMGQAGIKRVEKLQGVIEQSGKFSGTDEQSISSRAIAAWMKKQTIVQQRLVDATAALENPPILDITSLRSKNDLNVRRELVRKLIKCSKDVISFFANFENDIRSILLTEGAEVTNLPRLSLHLSQKSRDRQPDIEKIRGYDVALGEAILRWLDLVEQHWGKWKMENEELVFNDPEAQKNWLDLSAELGRIASDQMEAQKALLDSRVKN